MHKTYSLEWKLAITTNFLSLPIRVENKPTVFLELISNYNPQKLKNKKF